jgi:hypothetical protein
LEITTNKMKFFDWFKPRNWGIVKVYRDFENFADWRNKIIDESLIPESKFNKWGLKYTKLYDVYLIVNLDEADIPLPEHIKRTKVIEYLNPLNRYLDEELGFAECLSCEFNQFEDDDKKPTLSYLIVYRFIFTKFSLLWLLKFLLVNTALLIIILKFKLIPLLFTWLLSLI